MSSPGSKKVSSVLEGLQKISNKISNGKTQSGCTVTFKVKTKHHDGEVGALKIAKMLARKLETNKHFIFKITLNKEIYSYNLSVDVENPEVIVITNLTTREQTQVERRMPDTGDESSFTVSRRVTGLPPTGEEDDEGEGREGGDDALNTGLPDDATGLSSTRSATHQISLSGATVRTMGELGDMEDSLDVHVRQTSVNVVDLRGRAHGLSREVAANATSGGGEGEGGGGEGSGEDHRAGLTIPSRVGGVELQSAADVSVEFDADDRPASEVTVRESSGSSTSGGGSGAGDGRGEALSGQPGVHTRVKFTLRDAGLRAVSVAREGGSSAVSDSANASRADVSDAGAGVHTRVVPTLIGAGSRAVGDSENASRADGGDALDALIGNLGDARADSSF